MQSFASKSAATRVNLPVIVQYTDSKLVVLLTHLNLDNKSYCGTVLISDRDDYPIGTYSSHWWKSKFTPFNEVICISN